MVMFMLFAISVALAIGGFYIKGTRLYLSSVSLLLMGLVVGFLSASLPYGFGLIFGVLGVYQVLNIARLVISRLHDNHLRKAFIIGGTRLLALQITVYLLGYFTNNSQSLSRFWGSLLPIAQLVVAAIVLSLILTRLVKSKPKNIDTFLSDQELPTVSVLIPARNEDSDLIEVLKSVVANDYPKLEVLVLDDCSTSGRVPEIVREFAHDGVRFIEGEQPKEGWLAKNQAYATLANDSSGDWLLFMGVDVRLGTGSIRSLVHYAYNNKKAMISVLPHRSGPSFWQGFFSPLRYFVELVKVGVSKPNVPALSTAWLIERKSYLGIGGIESVARKVIPEHYFANTLNQSNSYSFVRTDVDLQVSTAKSLLEQLQTSLRVTYPGLHGRMEWSALSTIAMFVFLFMPFVQLVSHALDGFSAFSVVYLLAVLLLSTSHMIIVITTNAVLWPLAIINFPYLVLQEIVLGFISMYRYEFGTMLWKERNICLPVMQVVPHLPNVEIVRH